MTRLQRLVPWMLALPGLLPALLLTAFGSAFAFFSDVTPVTAPPVIPPLELLGRAVRFAPLLVLVAAVAAAIGLSSASYAPRRLERWAAGLIVAFAFEHAALAVAVLAVGVTGFEGAIVLSAPVFVITGLGVGSAALRGRRWARPALAVATVPVLGWTAYMSYIIADLAFRTPTSPPGVGHIVGVVVGLLAIGAVVAVLILRRMTER